jgi:hypothetical protein
MRISPTQRSLQLLRERGYHAGIVERWVGPARKRIDLFGFGDLVALGRGEIVIIQTTTGDNMASRRVKMMALPEFSEWLRCGGVVELHGWRKKRMRTKRGKIGKRVKWEPRVERFDALPLDASDGE